MNTNNLEDRISDNAFARDLPAGCLRDRFGAPQSTFSTVLTVRGLPLAAITFFVLAGSQSTINGPGAPFSSASSTSTSHPSPSPVSTSSNKRKHMIDNNRSACQRTR
ncbi:hypothetical protein RW1_025_00030 [Rhodococcus wratislaviensis NBRC 100605]|uniref:Uncharacterized protein n=1 Tax=Rhodococcus wratislaviensis NBRC 100605 TaxID=1219028 RepID=X0Q3K2_RHOWR|nr:hypothetical protein RW1_025_00030 [Rhodococcus wratislaviensis NBRC 100605]